MNTTHPHGSSLLSDGQPFGEYNGNRVGLSDVLTQVASPDGAHPHASSLLAEGQPFGEYKGNRVVVLPVPAAADSSSTLLSFPQSWAGELVQPERSAALVALRDEYQLLIDSQLDLPDPKARGQDDDWWSRYERVMASFARTADGLEHPIRVIDISLRSYAHLYLVVLALR
jgi:uncharacterized protein (DUF3820 family)